MCEVYAPFFVSTQIDLRVTVVSMILMRYGALLGNESKKNRRIVDREGHSPLDLLSVLLKERFHSSAIDRGVEGTLGGDVYSFGKADFQVCGTEF